MADILRWRRKNPSVVPVVLVTGLPGEARDQLPTYLAKSLPGHTLALSLSSATSNPEECLTCQLTERIADALYEAERIDPIDRLALIVPDDCDPMAFADSLEMHRGEGPDLRINTVITVIDATTFWSDFSKDLPLSKRKQRSADRKGSDRSESGSTEVAELLATQIEFCDVILLTHRGLVESKDLQEIEYTLRMLQPRAEILRAYDERIRIDGHDILDRYGRETTALGASWRRALKQVEPHFEQPNKLRGTHSTMVFRRRRPVHPERFYEFILDWPESIVRCFGTIWLPSRNDLAFSFSQVGPAAMSFSLEGEWLAALPPEERTYAMTEHPELMRYWDKSFGDRYTELVFIGDELDQPQLLQRLEACLLTDWEMRLDWKRFNDPILRGWDEAPPVEEPAPVIHKKPPPPPAPRLRLVHSTEKPHRAE